MIFYWLLLKYSFTGIENPHSGPELTFGDMISGALYYNIVTLLLSFVLYYPIVQGIKRLKLQKDTGLLLTGFVLTLTTPIFYLALNNFGHNDYYQLKPELIAWFLCFCLSIGFYYLANKA